MNESDVMAVRGVVHGKAEPRKPVVDQGYLERRPNLTFGNVLLGREPSFNIDYHCRSFW